MKKSKAPNSTTKKMGKKKGTKTLLAFLSGAAAGAAIAILFAPGRGSDIRDRLSFQLEKAGDKLGELKQDLIAGKDTSGTNSTARTEGERVIRDAKSKAEALLGDVDSLMSQINRKKDA